jgi:hypothetical protein
VLLAVVLVRRICALREAKWSRRSDCKGQLSGAYFWFNSRRAWEAGGVGAGLRTKGAPTL